MQPYKRILTLILLVLVFSQIAESSDFRIQTGAGYDFFTQEFFADSATQAGIDSFLTEWSLKSNYLDDFKGIFDINYNPGRKDQVDLSFRHEQTHDFIRNRFSSKFSFNLKSSKLKIFNEFELKNKLTDSSYAGDEYFLGNSQIKFDYPIGKNIKNNIQFKTDFVAFNSSSEYAFNYFRTGGSFGFTKYFQNFSMADISFFFNHRQAPDSLPLNYNNFGINFSLLFFHNKGEFDISSRFENKNYNLPDNKDDHGRIEISLRNKLKHTDKFFTRQNLSASIMDYNSTYITNYNYHKIDGGFLFGLDLDGSTLMSGITIEYLGEEQIEYFDTDKYLEFGLKAEFAYFLTGRFFGTLESITGKRNMITESEFQTDFIFQRVNFISDFNLYKSINSNCLFSSEWEWHKNKNDNTRIYLLSTNLMYTF